MIKRLTWLLTIIVCVALICWVILIRKSHSSVGLQTPITATSTIQFQGTISKGQKFEKDLGNGLVFQLIPNEDGWHVEVAPKSGNEVNDYGFASIATPPFHGATSLDIQGSDFSKNTNNFQPRNFSFVLNKKDANAMADAIGQLTSGKAKDFSPDVHSFGHGQITFNNLKLSTSSTSIQSVNFMVQISYSSIWGFP
jgi:hypothetical protein